MTTDQLRQAEAHYQRASRVAEEARQERNRLICEALTAGWTHARIAEAIGLSRGRISQFASASGCKGC